MTTLNGHAGAPASVPSFPANDAVITGIGECRKREWREAGFQHASFKRVQDPNNPQTLSFLFWPGSIFEIDEGFCFNEKELIYFSDEYNCSILKPGFYPPGFQVPRIAAARAQSTNGHAFPSQPSVGHAPQHPQHPEAVEFDRPMTWDVAQPQPSEPSLCAVFGNDIASLYNQIRQVTGAPPAECQRMATSAFIALRQAEDKLTPEQVEQLRKGSR